MIVLTWPVPQFTQRFVPASVPGRTEALTVAWCGNEVRQIAPAAKCLPMYPASSDQQPATRTN